MVDLRGVASRATWSAGMSLEAAGCCQQKSMETSPGKASWLVVSWVWILQFGDYVTITVRYVVCGACNVVMQAEHHQLQSELAQRCATVAISMFV